MASTGFGLVQHIRQNPPGASEVSPLDVDAPERHGQKCGLLGRQVLAGAHRTLAKVDRVGVVPDVAVAAAQREMGGDPQGLPGGLLQLLDQDRKSTRLNYSHVATSYAVFCLINITHCSPE